METNFKVGDRVKVTNKVPKDMKECVGKTATISDIKNFIEVKFDDNNVKFGSFGDTSIGLFTPMELELLPVHKFKVGDKGAFRPKNLQEALGHIVEELGEALQATGKSLRYGLDSTDPTNTNNKETNGCWMLRELKDALEAIDDLSEFMPDRYYKELNERSKQTR